MNNQPSSAASPVTVKPPLGTSPVRPSHVRYWVIVFAVTLAIITYIDRVCISQAAPHMQKDLGISEEMMGWAYAAFFWAYALFEVPGGWMGDRWGARKVLMRVVVWWSVFTAATGWAWSMASLIVTRGLFGAGEAGCFPNLTKAFTTWLSSKERVRAQGILWLSARWGGALTPLLVVLVLKYVSWRHAFELFGAVGIVWAVLFYLWYRDNPRDNPKVNAAELTIIPPASDVALGHGRIPWKRFLASKSVWLLWAQYLCLNYGAVFYITRLPTYLQKVRGVEPTKAALLAGIPLFCGGVGSLFCGFFSAHLDRWTGDARIARRWLSCTGFLGAAVGLALSVNLNHLGWGMFFMGLASFCNDLVMPPSWAACMDIGGKACGTLSGSMNMMGNFGGGLCAVVMGYIMASLPDTWSMSQKWALSVDVSAAVYFLGIFFWLFLDPVTRLDEPEAQPVRAAH